MEIYGDPNFAKHVCHSSPKCASLSTAILRSLLRNISACKPCALLIRGFYLSTQPTTRLSSSRTWTSQSLFDSRHSHSLILFLRVEDLAEKSSIKSQVDFHKLRRSLSELREASLGLDKEKVHAYWQLKKAIWKLQHRRVIRHKLRKAYCKVRRWFGKTCHTKHGHRHKHEHKHEITSPVPPNLVRGDEHVKFRPRIGHLLGWVEEQGEQTDEHHGSHRHSGLKLVLGRCRHGRKEVIRAAKHVRDVNKRLSKFEQGFISEGGIKDREWYRHLGVAPGKWLGAWWFHVYVWRL